MPRLTQCPGCSAEVNPESVVWKNAAGEVAPWRPDGSAAARLEWRRDEYAPQCSQGHPLPLRVLDTDVVIMTVVGPSTAGKSCVVAQMGQEITRAALSERGLQTRLQRLNLEAFNSVYEQETVPGTAQAKEGQIRLASVFEVDVVTGDRRARPAFDLMVFDCGGEDHVFSDKGTLRKRTPFLPMSDIVVFALPPDGLPELPATLRRSDQKSATRSWFQLAAEWVAEGAVDAGRNPQECTVVALLTKADRYQSQDRFDLEPHLLRPRKLRGDLGSGLDQTMAGEQPALFEFVQRAGGEALLELISQINNRVYLAAVSGAAGDDRPDGPKADQMLGMGANRALDPLLITLMRRGFGNFRAKAIR